MESWRGVGWIKFKSFLCTVTLDKSLNPPVVFPCLAVKMTLCGNAQEMKDETGCPAQRGLDSRESCEVGTEDLGKQERPRQQQEQQRIRQLGSITSKEGKEGEPRTEAERRRCPASSAHSVLMGTSCSGQAWAGCPYKAEIGHGREVGNTMKPLKCEAVAGRILDQTLACRPLPHLPALKTGVLVSYF